MMVNWSHPCVPASIRRPHQVWCDDLTDDEADDASTFESLPQTVKAEYDSVSRMEFAAFLSWLLAKSSGRSLQNLLSDAQQRPGLWAEVEKSWESLSLDEKSDWVPVDAKSFLQLSGVSGFLSSAEIVSYTPVGAANSVRSSAAIEMDCSQSVDQGPSNAEEDESKGHNAGSLDRSTASTCLQSSSPVHIAPSHLDPAILTPILSRRCQAALPRESSTSPGEIVQTSVVSSMKRRMYKKTSVSDACARANTFQYPVKFDILKLDKKEYQQVRNRVRSYFYGKELNRCKRSGLSIGDCKKKACEAARVSMNSWETDVGVKVKRRLNKKASVSAPRARVNAFKYPLKFDKKDYPNVRNRLRSYFYGTELNRCKKLGFSIRDCKKKACEVAKISISTWETNVGVKMREQRNKQLPTLHQYARPEVVPDHSHPTVGARANAFKYPLEFDMKDYKKVRNRVHSHFYQRELTRCTRLGFAIRRAREKACKVAKASIKNWESDVVVKKKAGP